MEIKMKRKLFALLLACTLASTAMAGCAGSGSGDNSGSGTSQTSPGDVVASRVRLYSSVIQNGSSKPVYCAGNRVFVINDDDTCEIAQVADGVQYDAKRAELKNPNEFKFRADVNRLIETDAFGTNYDWSADIYHWDVTDPAAVKETVLYPADMVKKFIADRAVSQGAAADNASAMVESCISDLLSGQSFIDGGDGYIYKVLNANVEDRSSAGPVAFNVMTLSRNGDKLGFISDIRAGAFATGSGFIYYYDAGYTYDKSTGDVRFDSSKAGLYRSLADGSNKAALISDMQPDSSSGSWTDKMKNTVVNLRLINTELFYIDNSEKGDGCLYKLSTDGGTPEKVSENKCTNYYYDREGGTLYYFSESAPNGNKLYSRNMATGEESVLFIFGSAFTGGETMGICGDFLYFSNPNDYIGIEYSSPETDRQDRRPSGQRYNLKTGELENLRCEISFTKFTKDDDGNMYVADPSEPEIKWIKYEPNSTDGDIKVFP